MCFYVLFMDLCFLHFNFLTLSWGEKLAKCRFVHLGVLLCTFTYISKLPYLGA